MLLYVIPLAWGAVTILIVAACQVASRADLGLSSGRDARSFDASSPPASLEALADTAAVVSGRPA
jgi:hypothetical protein